MYNMYFLRHVRCDLTVMTFDFMIDRSPCVALVAQNALAACVTIVLNGFCLIHSWLSGRRKVQVILTLHSLSAESL